MPVLLNRSGLTLQQLYQLLEVAWVTEVEHGAPSRTTTIAGVQLLSSSAGQYTAGVADLNDPGQDPEAYLWVPKTTSAQVGAGAADSGRSRHDPRFPGVMAGSSPEAALAAA